MEALKQGVTFKHYKPKEKLCVDWTPIQSSNIRFIQMSRKKKMEYLGCDKYENRFVADNSTKTLTRG